MFRRTFPVFAAIAIVLFIAMPTQAHGVEDIYVDRVWAAVCPDNTIAVFMMIDNTDGGHPIALISAESPLAAHGHLLMGDQGCTDTHIDRIVVAEGEMLNFWDANMAVGLEMGDMYQAGDPITVTLTFDMLDDDMVSEGETVAVTVAALVLESAPEPSNIRVQGAWVRPTADAGAMTGHNHSAGSMQTSAPMFPTGAYMRLLNRGTAPERLIAAFSTVAGITKVHETSMENDVMRMSEVEGIDLPTGEWVTLEPGGFHIMLIDLMRDLKSGEAIVLTLVLESGEEITLAVPVYDGAERKSSEHSHHHNH